MNDMIDMSRFTEAKSDQLNADDLIGVSRTLTVTKVSGAEGDQPIAIHYEGDNGKPFKPCKTIRRVLLAIWGRYANDYVGRSMTVYRDDSVQFGGLQVGGIRISHMTGIDKETVVVVAKSKGKKAGMKILPLVLDQRQTSARQTPQQWVASHIEAVDDAAQVEDLDVIEKAGAKALVKLERDHPDLHAQVIHAYSVRRSALTVEGKPETDRGEAFSDDGGFAEDEG